MKEARKGKIEDPKTFIHIEINKEGEIKTDMLGNTLILLGLCDVARDNVKARMQMKPAEG